MQPNKKISITKCAAISCSTQFKNTISPETLVSLISGEKPLGSLWPYVEVFFNELPHEYILGTLMENNISIATAVQVFKALPQVYQGKNFKELCHAA